MKIQFIKFLNTYGKSKVIVLTVLMLVVAHTHVASAATLKLPPTNLGLVGYWPMDEGAGSVTKDISGNKNNATFSGTPTWTTGKLGQALLFNGTNSYISTSNSISFGNKATISFWIKHPAVSSFGTKLLFELSINDNNNDAFGISFNDNSGGTVPTMGGILVAMHSAVGYSIYSTNNRYDDNRWHLVTVIFDRTQVSAVAQTSVYVDGQLVTKTVVGSYNNIHSTSFGSYPVFIGARSGGSFVYDGSLDDLRTYNRALSAAEIQQLYQAGVAKMNTSTSNKNTSGLVGYWTFDGADTTTTTATDKSGSGNSGTLTSSPTLVNGKIGQALKFASGSGSYVSLGATGLPYGASSRTMCLWIKPTSISSGYHFAMAYGNSASGQAFFIGRNADSLVVGGYGDDITSTSYWVAGTWNHICGVYNGTTASIYSNGTFLTSALKSWNTVQNLARIGQQINVAGEFWDGFVDDARIYNRALSASEIKQIYNTGAGSKVNSSQVNTPSSSLATGLVGYWSFNGPDVSGTIAYDRSTGAHNGTLTNSPSMVFGKMGQALNFNGTTQYVNTGAQLLSGTNDFTVSTWIKSGGSQNTYAVPISQGHGTVGLTGFAFQYGYPVSTDLQLIIGEGAAWKALSFSLNPATDLAWHHLVATKVGSVFKTYKDGVLQTTYTASFNGFGVYNFSIGEDTLNTDFNHRTWKGNIDEVRVYNRGLSASEINQLYLLGK